MLEAGAAQLTGDRERAEELLAIAAEGFASEDMALWAAVTRRRLGQVRGGADGRKLMEEADAWMSRQRILNPRRMTGMMLPGFPNDEE